jgi:transposase
VSLVTDRAVLTSSVLMTRALAAQMKTTLAAIAEFDAEISAVNEEFAFFKSLLGAGPNYAARLTAAPGPDRGRGQSADEVAQLSGIAPVIERSGQSCRVRWRYFCPKFLRQTFHEYAVESVRYSFWA